VPAWHSHRTTAGISPRSRTSRPRDVSRKAFLSGHSFERLALRACRRTLQLKNFTVNKLQPRPDCRRPPEDNVTYFAGSLPAIQLAAAIVSVVPQRHSGARARSFREIPLKLHADRTMSCCGDVMKPIGAAGCCGPNDTAADAAQAMRNSGCGCAPVIEDAHTRKVVGVVTERDVCCGVAADDQRASAVGVAEIMRPASACCGMEESVEAGRKKLHEHHATSLPVVDKSGSCCGTVSSHHLEHA
jgi:CBS domain-containing protein